ncbi:MAG: YidB family protein [Pyrinomonadaceae bacterium]
MALFDSIIGEAKERFGLSGDSAGGLLSALLGLVADPKGGGFGGFIDRFKNAGLGDLVNSWITTGDNTPLSNEQLESALGADTISSIASQAGVDKSAATSAMAGMIPQVVDTLTPDGEVPDEDSLLSRVGGFMSGWGGAAAGAVAGVAGAAGAMASGAADKVGGVAGATLGKGKEVLGGGVDRVSGAAGAVGDRVSGAMGSVGNAFDRDDSGGGGGVMKWLLPLLLLGLLVALGFWFCGKQTPTTTTNSNANANRGAVNANSTAKSVDSSFKIDAKDGKYTVSGVVHDQATMDAIKAKLDTEFGAGNVDYAGLKVDTTAKPFAAGWWDNFGKMLPNMKDWKNGTLAFAGNAVTTASGLPAAALAQLKSLFTGWTLPVSVAGVEDAAKQANEEAAKQLASADSVEEVVKALNVSIINFASGKSDIPADAKPVLEQAAEVLKKQPAGSTVEIGGHTDSDGADASNMSLSQARADSVKKALVGLGVADAMLTAKGYGETAPVAANDTPDNKFKNRRIEYKTGSGGAPTATTTETKPAGSNSNAPAPPSAAKPAAAGNAAH